MARKRLPKALADRVRKGDFKEVRIAELAAHFFDAVGGPREVARLLYEEFKHSPAGGVVRQRILDMILRAAKLASDELPPMHDTDLLTDDDLEREIVSLTAELLPDDEPTPGEPAAGSAAAGPAGTEAQAGPSASGTATAQPDTGRAGT